MDMEVIDTLDYRGIHVDFYDDDSGQQVYTFWEGQTKGFGAYNTMYKEDMKGLIDKKLDTIYEFDKDSGYLGTCISWYDNNGWDDIKITYRTRIIKIVLTTKPRAEVNLTENIIELLKTKAKSAVDEARNYMR